MVSNLVLTYFGRSRLGRTIKTNCITLQTIDRDMLSFDFYKMVWE